VSTTQQPLVSVVTPVYNGEDFLAECMESVLKQTYENYEYIIVNNCSTDRTLQIALDYAKKDSRIRVHNNESFVAVIANHNIAFRLISSGAKYCKVVSADDFLFPDCIKQMVKLAEANPSVGIVGSYQLSGDLVRWQGFRYPRAVLSGVEMCRQVFLGGQGTSGFGSPFGFGSPTSILYRADLVRSTAEFYPNASPHSDTSACFACLQNSDFGFVYEVLSFERTHPETQSSASAQMNRYSSANLNDVICYGPFYLDKDELAQKVAETLQGYHRFLAVNYFCASRGKKFWDYHRGRLAELGYPLKRFALLKAAVITLMEESVNPGHAIAKLRRRLVPRLEDDSSSARISGSPVKETLARAR
jgi:glycosyltransferase involved in cell wall biosynthesis